MEGVFHDVYEKALSFNGSYLTKLERDSVIVELWDPTDGHQRMTQERRSQAVDGPLWKPSFSILDPMTMYRGG